MWSINKWFGFFLSKPQDSKFRVSFTNSIKLGTNLYFFSSSFCADEKNVYLLQNNTPIAVIPRAFFKDGGEILVLHPWDPYLNDIINEFIHKLIWSVLLLNITKLNMAFLHASAVSYHGKGLLFTGWGGIGKTSIMLHFIEEGAKFLSNDWSIIDKNGKIYAFPYCILLTRYNLVEFPNLYRRFKMHPQLMRYMIERKIMTNMSKIGSYFPSKLVKDMALRLYILSKKIDESFALELPCQEILKESQIDYLVPIHTTFLLLASNKKTFEVYETTEVEIANRVWPYVKLELSKSLDPIAYVMEAAFPEDKWNDIISHVWKEGKKVIIDALSKRPCYAVCIPKVKSKRFYLKAFKEIIEKC